MTVSQTPVHFFTLVEDQEQVWQPTRYAADGMLRFTTRDLGLPTVPLFWLRDETIGEAREREEWQEGDCIPQQHHLNSVKSMFLRASLEDGRVFRIASNNLIAGCVIHALPTAIFIHMSQSPWEAAISVAHEVRHIYQAACVRQWHGQDSELLEMDARDYAADAVVRCPGMRLYRNLE